MRPFASSIVTLAALLLVSPALPAAPLTPGRVAHIDGLLRLDNGPGAASQILTENAVLRDGDELSTPPGSYVELELPGGTFVRIAGSTRLVVDRQDDQTAVVLVEGLLNLRRGLNAPPVSLVAFQCRVALDQDAEVRAELTRDEPSAEVAVLSGRAELLTAAGSEVLAAGNLVTQRPGAQERGTWTRAADAFDDWVATRVARRTQAPQVPVAAADYVGLEDLADAGEWVRVDGQARWRPFVDASWRPYSAGSWSWVEPYGWVFVPDAPWGYVTHHYGRWAHDEEYGWLWVPDPVFGGAHVAWVVGGPYVGWAPLDPYGRAVMIDAELAALDALVWIFADLSYFFWGGGFCDYRQTFVYVSQSTINDYDVRAVANPQDDLAPTCDAGGEGHHGRDDDAKGKGKHGRNLLARELDEHHPTLALADPQGQNHVQKRPNPPRFSARRAELPAAQTRVSGTSRFDGARSLSERARPRYSGVRTPVSAPSPVESPTSATVAPIATGPSVARRVEPSPAPVYRPTTPQAPAASYSSPTLESSYRPSASAPSYRPAAPTPSYHPSEPTPSYHSSAPAPSYHPAAPAPSYHAPAPSSPPSAAPAKSPQAPAQGQAKEKKGK